MKKGIIYSFIISLVICMIMPFSVFASSTGSQVSFTNSSSYSDQLILYRTDIQPISNYTGSTYTYAYYFITEPGMTGTIQGYESNNSNNRFAVGVQNGMSQLFYSNQTNLTVSYVSLVEYNMSLPQSVIDYIANIDSNVEITTDLLDRLVKLRQWHIPFESYLFVDTFLTKLDPIYIHTYNNYDWPVFDVSSSWYSIPDFFLNSSNQGATYIFLINKNIQYKSAFKQYFRLYNYQTQQDDIDYTITSKFYGYIMGETWYLIRVNVAPVESNTFISFRYINSSNAYIIPIYKNYKEYNNISTDFALMWGLSNQLLDDLHIVAQGTQQSQSAAGDLEQGTSDLASDISSYNQIESDYNNQMNQALNNIDFSDQFSNNQNFLSGASFVKTVFNSFMQIDILRIFFIVLCIVLIAKRFI